MKLFLCAAMGLGLATVQAAPSVSGWTPIFRGIDLATGTNTAGYTGRPLSVNAARIDLQDPDIRLLITPPITNNYVPDQRETFLEKPGEFLRKHGLKLAVNSIHFSPGGYNLPSGTAAYLHGLAISEGRLVSAQTSSNDAFSAILVTTNNEAAFVYQNWPPTNTAGIFTGMAGIYPLLSNGVNISYGYLNAMSDFLHQAQPRTAFGLSQDRRYLFIVVIDGRQGDFSNGAVDYETAEFLSLLGASDGMNVDGGGSACLDVADPCGNPIQINQNSYQFAVGRPGDERPVGCNFGVFAQPLPGFINDVAVVADSTTATIIWTTPGPASTQVGYGLSSPDDLRTPLDTTPVTNHSVTLTGLVQSTNYLFSARSIFDSIEYTVIGCFTTTNESSSRTFLLFDLTNSWRYSVSNLDGQSWQAPLYPDLTWSNGPGLLYNDNGALGGPKGTLLPLNPNAHCQDASAFGYPYPTYYFRTRFAFTNDLTGVTLTFSNYLDDGAVFSLNGVEIHRAYMASPPTPIVNCMLATNYHCRPSGDATCPYLFNLPGNLMSNLLVGDNVLAVEVHNYSARSPDIAFGTALFYTLPPVIPTPPFIQNLAVVPGETNATVAWTTISNATSQVEYGLTDALGLITPLDPRLVTNHSVVLSGLEPLTRYYFRVVSTLGTNIFAARGVFTNIAFFQVFLPLTNSWRYTTTDLSGQNWNAPTYPDAGWLGQGPALLHIENNTGVYPRNTPLPAMGTGLPAPTYYFRTRFTLTNLPPGFALMFSNYVDDGAVFYLNGAEVQRLRMDPGPLTYTQFANGMPPSNDAISPDLFRVGGDMLTNLVVGENVLAAEVHQINSGSSDVVFGSAVAWVRALVNETGLRMTRQDNVVCVTWDGLGFTLQQSTDVGEPSAWMDVTPGPVKVSPYCVSNPPASVFFRLRQ